ncbi:MAG: endolytic transglycosylase MltG [Sulfuricurvum sp.]|uniref:endolytic transglycosylase MltG n=1 Tax=Sulfuricurvum sp. TaxID=2025608 RepID=UPI00260A12CA|nr:endolytic transglycosylase MltG [Sulfuricurvum sp.]MDD2830504.1 endolytic transglycosylase MltG [Sulfuricurvum sp.]MDD4949605.1 endolytic transglycosylase MltG [Sulfuricurvum sp.]
MSPITSPKIVYIPQGSVFKSIAHLREEGVNLYKFDALILRLIGQPQQGWINLEKENLSRIEYLYRLTTAKAATRSVTLIPGETTTVFLDQLANELGLDVDKLQDAYGRATTIKEGMFVPETYNIPQDINEEDVVHFLLQQSLESSKALSINYMGSYNEAKWLHIVTLASVIQKEAASIEDMPMVSSVIQNRLAKKMKLQMDGTLNYGEYSHQKVTARRIRTDESSYNTYKNGGLPEFPVCNVSKEALKAALHPKHTDYLYFVRGKNGEHVYSSYFSTHHQNIVNATK